jgi:hypothetical protein
MTALVPNHLTASTADQRSEGIGICEIAVAGDPHPKGEWNPAVTARLFARLRRCHVRDRTPGDAA